MDHATTRAILVPEIVKLISEKYHITEMEALDKFYTSATGASILTTRYAISADMLSIRLHGL